MTIRWTEEQYAEHLKKQRRGHLRSRDTSSLSNPKRATKNVDKGKNSPPSEDAKTFRIEVVSYRRQHTDPDNLVPKTWIDCIVQRGVIPDDSSKYISSIVKRVVVSKDVPVMTLIRVIEDQPV